MAEVDDSFVADVIGEETNGIDDSFVDEVLGNVEREASQLASDVAGQAELGPPGLRGFRARLSLADADTFAEKQAAFKKMFPEGELRAVPVSGDILFREDPSKPFAKVDAALTERFEPVGDIIDFIGGDIGAIAGETLATVGSRGLNLLPFLGRIFAGGFVGDQAQQGVQSLRGVQREPISETAGRSTGKATIGAGGGALGFGAQSLLNAIRGGGMLGIQPGAEGALEAAERLRGRGVDIGFISPITASDSPLIQRVGRQSQALLPTVERYMIDNSNKIARELESMGGNAEGLVQGNLDMAVKRARNEILESLRTGKTLSEGGEAIQRGIDRYDALARKRIDELYSRARELGSPDFDISSLKEKAADIKRGIQANAGDGTRRISETTPELNRVVDDILAVDDVLTEVSIEGGSVSSIEQLRALRQRLFDLKTVPKGEVARQPNHEAARLFNEISDIMNNPRNVSPEFIKRWRAASGEANERFGTLERAVIAKAAKDETPAQLAKRLLSANQVDNLRFLRQTISNKEFSELQDAFKSELLRQARQGDFGRTLSSFDDETLGMLLSPTERETMQRIVSSLDALNRTGADEALRNQSNAAALVQQLMSNNSSRGADEIFKMVRNAGGRRSPLGRDFRAALIDMIAKKAIKRGKGNAFVDEKAVDAALDQLETSGFSRLLLPDDIQNIRDLKRVAPFFRPTTDAGTSIQASEAAAGLRGLEAEAVQTIIEAMGVGRLFTSDLGARLLIGKGKAKSGNTLSILASTLSTALSPDQTGDENKKDEE